MIKTGAPQSYSGLDELRSDRRFRTELPVVVNTVLDDQAGWIVEISRRGVKVRGISAPPRSRVAIHYKGKFIEGTIRWLKPGLIGVILDEPLRTGPLGSICQQFHDNVAAFGKNGRRPTMPTFGRKV